MQDNDELSQEYLALAKAVAFVAFALMVAAIADHFS